MNPVIYAVVDPTATDPKARMMPVSGTDNNDGTCSLDTTGGGGGGGGGDASAANQATQITLANVTNSRLTLQLTELEDINTHTTSLDVAFGTQADAAASTDAGTFSLIALFKRLLGKFTTQFPASLGQKTSALSFAVVQASDATTPNLAVATSITVVNAATTNVASTAVTTIPKGVRTWIGYGTTSAGAGSCTLTVEGSMEGTVWKTIGTMTLTLATTITTDTNTDSFTDQSSFVQYRGRTASITGTGAAVTLKVGI